MRQPQQRGSLCRAGDLGVCLALLLAALFTQPALSIQWYVLFSGFPLSSSGKSTKRLSFHLGLCTHIAQVGHSKACRLRPKLALEQMPDQSCRKSPAHISTGYSADIRTSFGMDKHNIEVLWNISAGCIQDEPWQGLYLGHPRGLVDTQDQLRTGFCRVDKLMKGALGPETYDT